MIPQPRRLIPHLSASFADAALVNLFKFSAGAALTALAHQSLAGDPGAADRQGATWNEVALALFMLPTVLFAPLAGDLGDRIPKQVVMRWSRLLDVVICLLGCGGLWRGDIWMILAALFLLGCSTAFFSPVKYSSLPELVRPESLPAANAWVQAVTIVAILSGVALGGLNDPKIMAALHIALPPAGLILVLTLGLCAIGIVGAFLVPALPAARPGAPLRAWAFPEQVKALALPGVLLPALSLCGFWALGAATQTLLQPIAVGVWGAGQFEQSMLSLGIAVGIIAGAALAPLLLARAFPGGLPVAGGVIAGASLLGAGFTAHVAGLGHGTRAELWTFAACLFGTGLGAGLWEVTLQVLLQERAPAAERNRVMAAANVTSNIAIIGAMGFCAGGTNLLRLGSAEILVLVGGLSLALALGALWLYRGQVLCWLATLAVRFLFRVEVVGLEKVPPSGGCLVACNHQSLADGVILAAVLPRRIAFMVFRHYCELPLIGSALRAWGVMPVDGKGGARALVAAVEAATTMAKAGGVVGIFPEGKLTRSGLLDAFKPGIEHIAQRAGVPIVPCAIDGLWRSPYSFAAPGHRDWWRPRLRVRIRLGDPLPPQTPAAELRQAVSALVNELAQEVTDRDRRTLGARTLRRCRKHPFGAAVTDAQGTVPRWQLAAVALALRSRLGLAADEGAVGLLLPPGRAGAIANLAVALLGRTAVNLNHTTGASQLKRMCEMAGVRSIISAGPYLKRIGDPGLPCRMVMIEQLLPAIPKAAILWQAATLWLLPSAWRDRARADGIAALVFSSGSTGDPKGVQISHRQVIANCDAVCKALDLGERDVLLTPLPLFHSFGLIPGMWLGLIKGMSIACHPDPTDAKGLGELAARTGATFSITTATFVRGWMRRIPAEQLRSLRFAVAGAEKCPAELRQAFQAKYGGALLEGYGCTELAPVVSVNLPPVTARGETEIRERDGSVGRPLPGMHVLVTDPATREPLPTGREGLLVVRSPARMHGYLGRPDLDAKVFIHGGYDTGDIGTVDADGFVRITGRLARFAKIGGEMVPLDTVEGVLQAAVGDRAEVAVAAVPDPDRGERLIVLVAGEDPPPTEELLKPAAELAALWRPKARDVHRVAALPRLGTGKRDLAGVKKMAAAAAGG